LAEAVELARESLSYQLGWDLASEKFWSNPLGVIDWFARGRYPVAQQLGVPL